MKKVLLLLALLGVTISLSGCSLDYKKYDAKINGKQIYLFDEFRTDVQCDRISAWDVFLTYESDIYIVKNSGISSCNSNLYIRDGFDYISLANSITEGIFELDDILDYEWEFDIYKANFPLNNIDIERIEMTDEIGINEDYIITDDVLIQSIVDDMYFYCLGFLSGFEYNEEDILRS